MWHRDVLIVVTFNAVVLALLKWNHNVLVHVYNIYDKRSCI